jgi:hypothetical protein
MLSHHAGVARLTGAAAIGAVLVYAISVPVGSLVSMPAADAPGTEVLRFAADHRTGVLVAVILNGVAWCALMPIVFAGLRDLLAADGGPAAAVSFGCALLVAAAIGVLLVFAALLAYAAPTIDAPLARLLADGANLATTASAWPTVPCMIATGIALRRTGILPRATVGLAFASAAIECVSAVSVARSGALAPTGIALLAPAVFALWMAVVGVALLRRAAVAVEHSPVAA